ncbi:MAG: PASTA domain-containing protein [Actinobacteria bacterium]|nr:PASTA domain-containing protein [Actinomycetota bacterium]
MNDKIISERYKLLKKIATGGMADVYLATDLKSNKEVAIKILSPLHSNDRTFVARFRREAQILANLNHPNIVSIYDWGSYDNQYFISMEYLKGQSLKEIIERRGPLNPKVVAKYTIQICNALEAAHKNNLIHRDIKPQNIMIDSEGVVKVTDFGIAKILGGDETKTISIMGTAHYISPEQAKGELLDFRTDIYSLGIVMYEMLAGDVPFRGDNPIDISLKHINEAPVKPSTFIKDIPVKLEKIVMHCLEKDPQKRYDSAQSLRRDLENFLNNKPLTIEKRQLKITSRLKSKVKSSSSVLNITLISLTSIFFILFLIFSVNYISLRQSLSFVRVPPIENIPVAQAEKILKTYNLGLRIKEEVYSENIPERFIIDQSPKPDTSVPTNTYITVIISKGKENSDTITMPNLIGLTLEEAENMLKELKLELGTISKVYSDSMGVNVILDQHPEFGKELKSGEKINLTVSIGEKKVLIPNVIGWDYFYAVSQLESYGLTIRKNRVTNKDYPPGTIVGVYPPPGSQVKEGSEVTLEVTTTEDLVAVPDVTKMDLNQAQTLLQSNNINYEIRNISTDYSIQKGLILAQDPEGGTYITKGSFVILYVGE